MLIDPYKMLLIDLIMYINYGLTFLNLFLASANDNTLKSGLGDNYEIQAVPSAVIHVALCDCDGSSRCSL